MKGCYLYLHLFFFHLHFVNSVGGVNRESLSRTNDLRSADGNKTGAGINNSPSHQNRPPISRNTVVGENRNNVGNVNQEQNSSHFNSQRQSSVAGLPLGNFPYCSLTSIYGIPYLSFPLYFRLVYCRYAIQIDCFLFVDCLMCYCPMMY